MASRVRCVHSVTMMMSLSVHLQVCRALMVLSLLAGLAAILLSILGLKCTKIGRTAERSKQQMALAGGLLFILSGRRPRCLEIRALILLPCADLLLVLRRLHADRRLLVRRPCHPRLLQPVRCSQVCASIRKLSLKCCGIKNIQRENYTHDS